MDIVLLADIADVFLISGMDVWICFALIVERGWTMRIIDADRLLKGTEDHQFIDTHVIWNAPTVDAIPVEWIMKYTEENRLYQSDDFDWYIRDMIADWEEENAV